CLINNTLLNHFNDNDSKNRYIQINLRRNEFMNDTSFYLLFFLFSLLTPLISAQSTEDMDYDVYDSTIEVNGQFFRVHRIPEADFLVLHDHHASGCKVEKVSGFKKVKDLLAGEYTFYYEKFEYMHEDSLVTFFLPYEIREKDELRIFIDEVEGEVEGYYPEFYIFHYVGGHSTDAAIDLQTGERTDVPVSCSPDRTYCLTEMYDGHDACVYKFKRWNRQTQSYETITTFYEIARQLPYDVVGYNGYIKDYFWLGAQLYFLIGNGGYLSITMPQ
ncbi:MAG: hypothetical protein LUE98_08745, partial [Tannerellaceae bacterium]|nr:hypothetical protein [Tannerellaceae bacterium]